MGRFTIRIITLMSLFIFLGPALSQALVLNVPRIFLEEARALVENGGATVIDVRTGPSWEGSDRRIPGAIREDPGNINSWKDKYAKDGMLVLYCS